MHLEDIKRDEISSKQVILANGLETTDYYYTVQGMLKSINNPNSLGSDRFALTIGYFKGDYTNTNTAGTGKDLPVIQPSTTYNQYAGNIGTVRWNRRSNPTTVVDMTMNYVYDVKGQLRSSNNPGTNNSGTNSVLNAFNEKGIQYDANCLSRFIEGATSKP